MNEKHVTSLETSKRLKALGCSQESEYHWWKDLNGKWHLVEAKRQDLQYQKEGRSVSAFLASELGELLPEEIKRKKLKITKDHIFYMVEYADSFRAGELSESMGLMLAYLKEQKLV